MDLLEETGPYRFKLEWEQNLVIQSLEWTQELNPLAARDQDMSPTDVVWSNGDPNCPGFTGLALSNWRGTLLDGKVEDGHWFYSVGNSEKWKEGNPAVETDCGEAEYLDNASRTSLYVDAVRGTLIA